MEETLDKQEDPQAHPQPEPAESAQTPDADQDPAVDTDQDSAVDAESVDRPDESAPDADAAQLEVAATVEAILFSTDNPISPAKIALVAELPGRGAVKEAISQLNERYGQVGCAFRIESIAGGYQMLTQPEYHDVVARLFKNKSDSKLSQAAMETLAIVAYRQPILRADIEAIRGVASGEMLRNLLDKNLAKIVGRAEVLGRPMLYGTSKRFLEVFGLNGIEDLPNVEALRGGRDDKTAPAETNDKSPQAQQPQPAPADEETEAEAQDAVDPQTQPEPQAEPAPVQQPENQVETEPDPQAEAEPEPPAEAEPKDA